MSFESRVIKRHDAKYKINPLSENHCINVEALLNSLFVLSEFLHQLLYKKLNENLNSYLIAAFINKINKSN